MKNSKIIALAIFPFMLVGCGNQGQQTKDGIDKASYTKKSVDFSTEEGCTDLISDLRKAVKATAPALLKNSNLEFDVSLPSLTFDVSNKYTNPTEEKVDSRVEGKINDLKVNAKAGVKNLSTATKFNDLVAYADISELKGSVNVKKDSQTVTDVTVPQIGLSAYLDSGRVYLDITKLSIDEIKKVTDSLDNEQVQGAVEMLKAVKEESNTFYLDSTYLSTLGVDVSNFTSIKLDENFEAQVDNAINYEAASTYIKTVSGLLPLADNFLEIGSDKNHKLIFTVTLDVVKLYGEFKEEGYKLYVEASKDSEEVLTKEEFFKQEFAESDAVMSGVKEANFTSSVKFNNDYVLSSFTVDVNLDLDVSRNMYDEEDEEVIDQVIKATAKGSLHAGLYVDVTTDVKTKLPDNLKDYPSIVKVLLPDQGK